jgi:acetyl-CoA synthetase
VIKVAGHRLSTGEIEDAIDSIKGVVESTIVAKNDTLRGVVPVAFVKTKGGITEEQVVGKVLERIGPIAKPAEVYFVDDIPKTRSGKMMRRVLRAILHAEDPGNIMTLINPECVEKIKAQVEAKHPELKNAKPAEEKKK